MRTTKIMNKQEQRQTRLGLSSVNNLRKAKTSSFFVAATLICALAFTSCNVNDDITDETSQAVRFCASIDNQAVANAPETRAAGAAWNNGDAIGIFMVKNGTTTISEQAVNKPYTTQGAATFTAAAGNEIYYPMNGSAVDFIAYYPYESGNVLTTAINVEIGTTQTTASQAGFDLLWARADNSGNGYNKISHAATPVAFVFNHKLAKIVMNCSADASVGTALTGMTVTIKGMNTKNTFNLATGVLGTPGTPAAITPHTVADGAIYDAIIMPGGYATGALTVEFTVGGETFTWNVGAETFVAGNEYTYAITLTRTGVIVTGTINPWIPVVRDPVEAEG